MSLLENRNLEIFVIWYFFIIGILGNTTTCYFLYRRIINFSTPIVKKNSRLTKSIKSDIDSSCIVLDKTKIFNRRHNWNLYLYFIGVNIFDIIVLFSWLISKLEIKVQKYSKISHTLPQINQSFRFLNQHEFENFISLYEPLDSLNYSTNTSFDNLMQHLNSSLRYIKIRLIDLQGVCQLNSYLITVSLQASYAYTVASIFDRFFKMKLMNRDFSSIKKSQHRYEIIAVNEPAKKTLNSDEITVQSTQLAFDIKRYIKSAHSDLIRQYFGKKSAFFIGITIILFYYHLIWIYMLIENKETQQIGEFRFRFDSSDIDYLNGSIYATSDIGRCQLPTFNVLPVLIQTMDVFFLLAMGLIKLTFGFILFRKYLKKKRSNFSDKSNHFFSITSSLITDETIQEKKKLKNKDKYFMVKCIVGTSIFSTLLELPSVLVRNVLMMFFFVTLLFKDRDLIITENISHSSLLANSTQNYLSNGLLDNRTNSSFNFEKNPNKPIYQSLPQILNNWCEYFDFLLLFTSSHKFMIFLFNCYFLNIPKFSFSSICKLKNKKPEYNR